MDLNYTEQNFNSSEILYSAQIIADAFADGMKQNNCLLMLTVSLHQELNDAINDYIDLDTIATETDNRSNMEVFDDTILDSIQEAIKESKSRCYSCKLTIPVIEFDMNLDEVIGKLKSTLEAYKNIFQIGKLDLCQAAYAMTTSCLPDILKLIVLLITAYASIMMLKNIGSISILAFIKGIISALLEKIFSSLKMSISIGGTNTSCIIEAIREIASSLLPTEERILAQLDRDTKIALGQDEETLKKTGQRSAFSNDYIGVVDDALSRADAELSRIDSFIKTSEKKINDTFETIIKVFDESMEELNAYIQNLLAFKSTFECEAKRSGTDIQEVIEKINRLIQVMNLLSAVAMSIAKKDAREKICSSQSRINAISDISVEDVQMKDIVEEYYGKEAEIVENPETGIQIIIYEKPKEPLLPKIDLLNCSIDDFIDSHNIDNIIKIAEDEVRNEMQTPNKTINREEESTRIGEGTYVVNKPSPEQLTNIHNIVNILYDDPATRSPAEDIVKDLIEEPVSEDIVNMIGTQGVSELFKENNNNVDNISLNCRTIDDVMGILNQIRR